MVNSRIIKKMLLLVMNVLFLLTVRRAFVKVIERFSKVRIISKAVAAHDILERGGCTRVAAVAFQLPVTPILM